MNDISVCIIAKNEEKNIRKCLRSLSPLQSEVVVVDTGSDDHTVEYAKEFTDKVYSVQWNEDFSAARNYAASKASNDMILAVDCDEFLVEAMIPLMKERMTERPDEIGMITRISPYPDLGQGSTRTMHEFIGRLYDRRIYRYRGTIHESVTLISDSGTVTGVAGGTQRYYEIPLTFFHKGYAEEEIRREKAERDLRMLQDDLAKNGPSPYTYFQMGKCYVVMNNHAMAARYFDLGLSMDVNPALNYVQEMMESYGYCLIELKQYQKALSLEAVYDDFAKRADFCFLMGLIYMNNARFPEAIEQFEKATTMKEYSIEGVNSYSANYNIGVIHECLGHREEALEAYGKCGQFSPAMERIKALR